MSNTVIEKSEREREGEGGREMEREIKFIRLIQKPKKVHGYKFKLYLKSSKKTVQEI